MADRFDWNDIQYFLETARSGRISRAAKRLGVSHTTVARHLSHLDKRLHNRLLDLDVDGYVPTEAGAALIPLAEEMEAAAAAILDRLERPGSLSGRVRVGAPDGFGNTVLSRLLPDLAKAEPSLEIELVPVPASHKLWNREVDIAVSLERPQSGRLVQQKLLDYDLRLYGSAEFLNDSSDLHAKEDLLRYPFVGYIDELLYSAELNFTKLIHPGIHTAYRAATVQAQIDAVTGGAGLGVLPCYMARAANLIPVLADEIAFTRGYWLLYGEDDREISRIRRVAGFIREVTQARQSDFRFTPSPE
ncbi:LysR family transcriptional regulator [Tropicimonas isoalkanivorans]|uniref:DNA-binding transcriptional regulator, LysR family n=1 Tax=Tropicimonas isoalkanivorans TaxID=441112 RepID=A0A1I1L9E4_9RHOB|nr:LysR family transcriptional regulator [Tropicimonas isoalkanivorans]SFC69621.1 DNA-binding transcriptional regulator, LysR family [Tropicimonas isoalkanivorans]